MPAQLSPIESIEIPRISDLAQIVESVFAAMLGLKATVCGAPWFPGTDRLAAAVHLVGDWNGAVLLECDRRQACRFAARFLSKDSSNPNAKDSASANPYAHSSPDSAAVCPLPATSAASDPPAVVEDVVRDVLGELANMIGGNLKCVLPGAIRLSMPAVVDGIECLRICKSDWRERLSIGCADGVFWVTVFTSRNSESKPA